jgi:hypothetical protein
MDHFCSYELPKIVYFPLLRKVLRAPFHGLVSLRDMNAAVNMGLF